jgi:hypothetical protein
MKKIRFKFKSNIILFDYCFRLENKGVVFIDKTLDTLQNVK